MVIRYVEIVMQLSSIGLVIAAAGLWAGAGVDARPRFRDEQTLVGGTIWSQIIIPIGLMISKIVEEHIDEFVQSYYLITGIILLWATGIVLILHEIKTLRRARRNDAGGRDALPNHTSHGHGAHGVHGHLLTAAMLEDYDKVYYAIGIICVIAGILKMCELVVILA